MSECLLTRLSEAVTDQSLPKLGCVQFKVAPSMSVNGALAKVASDTPCTLSLISGSLTAVDYNTSTPIPLPANIDLGEQWWTFASGSAGATIEISNVYDIKTFDGLLKCITEVDLKKLRYMENLSKFTAYNENADIYGDINVFAGKKSIFQIVLNSPRMPRPNIIGNIETWGECTSLTTISLYGTGVEGDLLQLAKNQRSNGRTSGQITFGWINGALEFNGTLCMANKDTTLSWNATSVTWNDITVNQ